MNDSVDNRHENRKKPRHRRAKIACLECRYRRVRCCVSIDSDACTNCQLDGGPCIFRPGIKQLKRQRRVSNIVPSPSETNVVNAPAADNNYEDETPASPAMDEKVIRSLGLLQEYNNSSSSSSSYNSVEFPIDFSDISSPASSCSTITTYSDGQASGGFAKLNTNPSVSSRLVGSMEAPGWFEVLDLTVPNEDDKIDEEPFDLHNLVAPGRSGVLDLTVPNKDDKNDEEPFDLHNLVWGISLFGE